MQKQKTLVVFFNGGGLSAQQWFEHPYEKSIKTDLIERLEVFTGVYTYNPVFYLDKTVIEDFKKSKTKSFFEMDDVNIQKHCETLYQKLNDKADKFILVSHSRGFMIATIFAEMYKDRVVGFINVDGGYTTQKYDSLIKDIEHDLQKNINIRNIDDKLLKDLSKDLIGDTAERDKGKDVLKILRRIVDLLLFKQHRSVNMINLEVPTVIMNNIYHNAEINLDMLDYVQNTLKDKIEFNEELKKNKHIVSRYYVNKTHFLYIGMEDEIVDLVKTMIGPFNGKIKRVYLVRHGQTDANKNKIAQGRELDQPLNDTGRKQADQTGKYLVNHVHKNIDQAIILSSPQTRAHETANIINEHLGLKVVSVDELAEIEKGKLSGLAESDELFQKVINVQKEFNKKYRDPIKRGLQGSLGFQYYMDERLIEEVGFEVGVEDLGKVMKRITKIIEMIDSTQHDNIIIVSHSGLLELMIKHMMGLINSDVHINIEGDRTNGKNCWISCFDYDTVCCNFRMVTAPNTEHFSL
ncbi:histidine phosphatase family protein [Yasminevirus sp. GU-2018]|uniref:Histidine phosphatase family protein n=1 Tax=Yasminevirus sp. GU-2018 TaxID=2420051 RepID=A0A5K0U9P3_9VIRU|nr:histidine phosphatase family protein [Yasminevirus sp. GU-2018]